MEGLRTIRPGVSLGLPWSHAGSSLEPLIHASRSPEGNSLHQGRRRRAEVHAS